MSKIPVCIYWDIEKNLFSYSLSILQLEKYVYHWLSVLSQHHWLSPVTTGCVWTTSGYLTFQSSLAVRVSSRHWLYQISHHHKLCKKHAVNDFSYFLFVCLHQKPPQPHDVTEPSYQLSAPISCPTFLSISCWETLSHLWWENNYICIPCCLILACISFKYFYFIITFLYFLRLAYFVHLFLSPFLVWPH